MLHEFLRDNRTELIARCRTKVSSRRAPRATQEEMEHGIPLFLDQLEGMLRSEGPADGATASERGSHDPVAESNIARGAVIHGSELLRNEFTVDQVVHDYGDLCQAITELAQERHAPITVQEFGTLNIRLDNAIAAAVTEYSRGSARDARKVEATEMNERLGFLAHEMRNLLNTTILALAAIKGGGVGFGGATAAALDRSLIGMRALIDRTLAEVRLESGLPSAPETIEIGPFISAIRVAAALEASQNACRLAVASVENGIRVQADRHILASALSNLLQNAFKFTRPDTDVLLRAWATGGRVLIEVEDECGGLAPGVQEIMFRPFEQGGPDRSGLGLGLALSRRGIELFGGSLYVRDVPGRGCVFTIDLPRVA